MSNGLEELGKKMNISRDISLQMDVKIPEVFVLSTSVIIIYLSTIQDKENPLYIFSVILFFLAIFLSLISLWKIRGLHANIYIAGKKGYSEIITTMEKSFTSVEKMKEAFNKIIKDNPINLLKNTKKLIVSLQRITFIFFGFGLLFLFLQPIWNDIISWIISILVP